MSVNLFEDSNASTSKTQGDSESTSSVLEELRSLWLELIGLGHDSLQLAGLETQRAGLSLVSMVIAGVLAAVFLSLAWLGILMVAVFGLLDYGIKLSNILLIMVVLHLVMAFVLVVVMRRKSLWLQFPATLRSLQQNASERTAKYPKK